MYNSMVIDLYSRICGVKYKGRDFMYATDEIKNESSTAAWCTDLNEYWECNTYQRGDNFEELSLMDVCVRHCDGFSGCAWTGRDLINQANAIRANSAWTDNIGNGDMSTYAFWNGLNDLDWIYTTTKESYSGWRAALWLRN